MSSDALLHIENVSKTYRVGGMFSRQRAEAVKNVSLQLPNEPSILALVGESGSGKTTLAKLVLKIEALDRGEIRLRDDVLAARGSAGLNLRDLRRRVQSIAQLPHDAFSAHLTIDYYLRRTAINLVDAANASDQEAAIDAALESVGLSLNRIAGKYPHQFSGGELQRISIARALIPRPELIVADEPVSMVDASIRMNIINLFNDLKEQRGVSFLYVTHDLSTAHYLSDSIHIMRKGEIVERGAPDTVFANPHHDYTKQLISSIPRIGERWAELT